jgi:hypothetical protein
MIPDLTIIYYTASREGLDDFYDRTRRHLLERANGTRIISVSQKPLDFGDNICLGDIGVSLHSLFKQVLIGAREAKTKFIACAEDDYLYSSTHFGFVPPTEDTFYYDTNRWHVDKSGRFFWRMRTIFGMCIAPTKAMIDTLAERFRLYPDPGHRREMYFSEPGKYEEALRVPAVKKERFESGEPTLTFNHQESLGRIRMVRGTDIVVYDLPPWGDGKTLWKEYYC